MLQFLTRFLPSSARSGSIENPSVPLSEATTDDWLGYEHNSKSGQRVSHQTAMKVAAFWQGVSMLSGDVAKIPLEIYERGEGTDRSVYPDHSAYFVVRRQANAEQSAYEFRRQMVTHALVWGNAYAIIVRDETGKPIELLPLLPDRTVAKKIQGRISYQTEIDGSLAYFDSYDIWHLKGVSFDGVIGLDPVRYARDGIGKILAREEFASRFFKNGGRIGGVLQIPFTKDKSKRDKMEAGFRRSYENNDAAFKTVVLQDNAKFHAAQASFHDSQLVEVGQQDVRHVARLLNIPAHKLGAEGSSSYNSLEQENQAYYDNCLSHWLMGIESECWLKLFDRRERTDNRLYFEHTIGALLWADAKTVSEIGTKGVLGGWLMPNEPRRWFNLNSVDGGDRLLVPSGMVVASEDEPLPETDEEVTRDALELLRKDVELRFLKRLAVHARKQLAKSDANLETWLNRHIKDDHLPIGEQMFGAYSRAAEMLSEGAVECPASQALTEFSRQLAEAEQKTEYLDGILSK